MTNEQFIVIGDIHGCPAQLDELLDMTSHLTNHKYVFLGDYIDRGPDSEGVINRIKTLDSIFLMGNHEEMLKEHLQHSSEKYVEKTVKRSGLSMESIEWIHNSLMDHYETENYIFVHAGLNKNKGISEQTIRDYLWIRNYGDYTSLTPKTVIHGHTDVSEPEINNNRININTGCGSKGFLTALALPEFVFYTSSQSPGKETDWNKLRLELERELEEFDSFGELEEV